MAHDIIVISYPPHTTHALQGLDLACFGPLKTYWGQEKLIWQRKSHGPIGKEHFLVLYSRARHKAFSKETILSAFRATGIVPFDRTVIKDSQLAPALEGSTKGGFPLPLPTPARNLVAIHRRENEAEASRDTSPIASLDVALRSDSVVTDQSQPPPIIGPTSRDSPDIVDLTNELQSFSLSSRPRPSGPAVTVRQVRFADQSDNPPPIPRVQDAVKDTSAGFLIRTSPLKSATRLPQAVIQTVPKELRPDYGVLRRGCSVQRMTRGEIEEENERLRTELAKAQAVGRVERSINEGANAQLVLRDMHLDRLTHQLYTKENKTTSSKRRLMSTKAARFLTGNKFRGLRRQQAEDDVRKAAEKEEAAVLRRIPKAREAWRQEERSQRDANQKLLLAQWEAEKKECQRRKRAVPPKPAVTKIFPRAPTPDHLKARRRRKPAEEDEEIEEEILIDVESEDSSSEED